MELRRNPLPEPPWLQVVGVLGDFGTPNAALGTEIDRKSM